MSQSDISTQRPGTMKRLAEWGITEIVGDYRAAKIVQRTTVTQTATVEHHKTRSAFTSECIDDGPAPHVSPDDHTIAVCLRCGRVDEELIAYVGHTSRGGPPYFGVRRRDGGYQHLTGRISHRAQRRIEKALRRAFGEAVRSR